MANHRLKNAKEIAKYRDLALKKQKNLDPITGLLILKPALDHDHATGKIRGVLDIRSNSWEGKVKNSFSRTGVAGLGADYVQSLRNLADYIEKDWTKNPLHPTYRTEDEKRVLKNRKAKKIRAKKARAKKKIKNE